MDTKTFLSTSDIFTWWQHKMIQQATEEGVFVVTNFIRAQSVREVENAVGERFSIVILLCEIRL